MPRAHHPDALTLAIEGAVLVLALLFGGIWLRERRRAARSRPPAEMRE